MTGGVEIPEDVWNTGATLQEISHSSPLFASLTLSSGLAPCRPAAAAAAGGGCTWPWALAALELAWGSTVGCTALAHCIVAAALSCGIPPPRTPGTSRSTPTSPSLAIPPLTHSCRWASWHSWILHLHGTTQPCCSLGIARSRLAACSRSAGSCALSCPPRLRRRTARSSSCCSRSGMVCAGYPARTQQGHTR